MKFKDKIYHALYIDDRVNVLKGRYEGQAGTVLRWLFADWYLVEMDKNSVEIVVGVHLGELEPRILKEQKNENC